MFSQKPKRMSVIVRKADELARKGQTDKAIGELNKALTQDPSSPATRLRKAELLARSGERIKACHLYESLAVHYAQRGFYSQAISMSKQALTQCPDRYDLMEKVADLYLQKGITR
jgi:tetratricopeptide (TPR) repeat protein